MIAENKSRKFEKTVFAFQNSFFWLSSLILYACGSNKSEDVKYSISTGFSSDYIPPTSNFEAPKDVDPYFKSLETILVEPYWIRSLEMDEGESVINKMLLEYERTISFSFPLEPPDYLPVTVLGWSPATSNMELESVEIFSKLEELLDIKIEQIVNPKSFNNLAISQSVQTNTSGFSYFPNNHYQLGSDIFISRDYSEPLSLKNNLTNYDLEVLLHEIGHALGLKHPFEGDRNNLSVLNTFEDQTKYTAMSYNDDPSTFTGTFRSLDWMALTKFYGVNPEYRPGDDEYTFNELSGVFIIDGSGEDTISVADSTQNVFVDLRSGTHSYQGQKSNFITAENQLTISHGSKIENVETGSGDDTIIGNQLSNKIVSAAGDDVIFAGEGEDVVYPGPGYNVIDLSEDQQVSDILVLEQENESECFETIYGFAQGDLGDIIDITDFDIPLVKILPVVDFLRVPSGYIDNCVVKLFGENLNDPTALNSFFKEGNILDNLKLSNEKQSVLITAESQGTGEDQYVYYLKEKTGSIEVQYLTRLAGNYLDIDNWSLNNFLA